MEDLHECFHCGEEFSSATDFKTHLETHAKPTSTSSQPTVRDLTVKGQKSHECFQCGEGFYNMSDLHNHMRSHGMSTNQAVVTTTSDRNTGSVLDLTVHGADTHECHHCGDEFGTEDLLNSHLVSQHQVKQFHCVQCGESFMQEQQLKTHELMHNVISPRVMSDVQMMYKSYANNTRPSTSTQVEDVVGTNTVSTSHECTECGKCFPSPRSLNSHKQVHGTKQSNKCKYCSKTFRDPYDLRRHLVMHTGERAYPCNMCPKKFTQTSALYLHMRQSHRTYPFVCSYCGEGFLKVADLKEHNKSHLEVEPEVVPQKKPYLSRRTEEGDLYKCAQCGDSFGDKATLNAHSEVHMRDMQEASMLDVNGLVKQEGSDGANVFNLNDNMDVVDLTLDDDDDDVEVAQYKCTHCEKSFRLEAELNAHIAKLHSAPDSYECHHCGEEFDTEENLKRHILTTHMRDTHALGAYKCDTCTDTFPTKAELQTHKDTKHMNQSETKSDVSTSLEQTEGMRSSGKVQQYTCLQCNQSFSSKPQLYKHCETHLETAVYKCYCGMEFSKPDHLERHKETHSEVVDLTVDDDDETYKCSLCDDVFTREEDLIVHMMTHPKQEQFECAECGRKFVFEKDYQFHLSTHVKTEGNKTNLVCSDCGAAFSQMEKLKEHMLTHEADKPHQCPVCQRRFATLAVLHQHEATHGTEPHKCQHCGAAFWQVHFLKRHLEKECSKLQQGTVQNGSLPGTSSMTVSIQSPAERPMGQGLTKSSANNHNPLSANGTLAQGMMYVKSETYTCCGWSFMSEADMKVHELSHKVTVYKCVQCMQVFRSPAALDTHVKTHTEGSSHHRVPNHGNGTTSSHLNTPTSSYMEGEHHRCLQCGKEFRTVGFLNRHMQLHKAQVHKANKCHQCNECGQKFLSTTGLDRHALTHGDRKASQCPVCNEKFINSAKLFEHMATHNGRNTHSCRQCGKTFKRSSTLETHMMLHAEDGVGEQHSEDVDMSSVNAPNIHKPNNTQPMPGSRMEMHHIENQDENSDHMCTYCGRRFKSAKHLTSHFRSHFQSISSTFCETKVKFADAAGKELHVVTRLKKKPCKCYICYKMFRRPSDLARHMMIHTGERPCKCSWCPEAFILLFDLKKHTLKVHKDIPPQTEEQIRKAREVTATAVARAKKAREAKNISTIAKYGRLPGYLCCGNRFLTYLQIQHHWLVHKEEERFACPHCELKFTKGFSRTKHIMKVHSATKPNCLDCGKEFAEFRELILHMKIHEAQLEEALPDPASSSRVEVYTDVADGEPDTTNGVQFYTDIADTGSVSVNNDIITDEEPEPLFMKVEAEQHSDPEVDPDMEVDSEKQPIALKKETSMDTTDDPSSPLNDAVVEEVPLVLKKEAEDPALTTNSADT